MIIIVFMFDTSWYKMWPHPSFDKLHFRARFHYMMNIWILYVYQRQSSIIIWWLWHYIRRKRALWLVTWMGSSDGWGRAKGWTNKANCIPDVFKRSVVQAIWNNKQSHIKLSNQHVQSSNTKYIRRNIYNISPGWWYTSCIVDCSFQYPLQWTHL